MNLRLIKQINKEQLTSLNFDVFIAASGYESRASYLARKIINKVIIDKKYVLTFDTHTENKYRKANDSFFIKNDFKFIRTSGSSYKMIIKTFDGIIWSIDKECISILIDYSSMTRVWYGSIINHLKEIEYPNKNINIYYSYSEAEYHKPPKKETETINFTPMDGFCNLSIPSRPTALITGLGYEKKRAFGLKEYFDAEVVNYFYTEDNTYTDEVLRRNKEILENVNEENKYPYSLNNLLFTRLMLQDLCESLSQHYRIILAPCGPKPFTLLSCIIASKIDSIDIWRISADDSEFHLDRKANGKLIILELTYK